MHTPCHVGTNMCIAIMSHPATWPHCAAPNRVRHWSAPDHIRNDKIVPDKCNTCVDDLELFRPIRARKEWRKTTLPTNRHDESHQEDEEEQLLNSVPDPCKIFLRAASTTTTLNCSYVASTKRKAMKEEEEEEEEHCRIIQQELSQVGRKEEASSASVHNKAVENNNYATSKSYYVKSSEKVDLIETRRRKVKHVDKKAHIAAVHQHHRFKRCSSSSSSLQNSWPWSSSKHAMAGLTLLVSSLFIVHVAEAKICSSIAATGVISQLERIRGCTVIEGHLIIAAMPDQDDRTNLTFPELREITDFMLLYEALPIKRLDQLFPNLAVIRGNRLKMDYALIIFRMSVLEEVGLVGLTHILRGGVRIEKNPRLCYVQTILWHKLVDPKYHSNIHIEENEYVNNCPDVCPKDCLDRDDGIINSGRKLCWNKNRCQTLTSNCKDLTCYKNTTKTEAVMSCDNSCFGGCYPTKDDCFSCGGVKLESSTGGSSCQKKCPDHLLKYERWRCISESQCRNITYSYNVETIDQQKPYKTYMGECLEHCPPATKEKSDGNRLTCEDCKDCPKECPGDLISSLEDLNRFDGCTKIVGDLTIQLSIDNVVQELETYLHRVKVITGSLKISRAFRIVSLDFFKSLEEIQGIHAPDSMKKKYYSLQILENENLQKLFPRSRRVKVTSRMGLGGQIMKGRAFIHENPKLCTSEIQQLLNSSGMIDPGLRSEEISYATNGGKAVCSQKKLNLRVFTVDMVMHFEFDNYQKAIVEEDSENNYRALLGYEIHYREISEAVIKAKNLTKYDGRDACGGDEWKIIDHTPSEPRIGADGNHDYPMETVQLPNTKPYTHYAAFVTTLITRDIKGGENIEGAQSDIVYAVTPEDTPTVPRSIQVERVNYSTVNITWLPPSSPNGIIDHYELVLELQSIDRHRIMERPFCNVGYGVRPDPEEVKDEEGEKTPVTNGTAPDGTCDCRKCGKPGTIVTRPTVNKQDKQEEDHFHDEIINEVFQTSFPIRTKRTAAADQSKPGHKGINDISMLDDNDGQVLTNVTTEKSLLDEEEYDDDQYKPRVIPDSDPRYMTLRPGWTRPFNTRWQPGPGKEDIYKVFSTEIAANQTHLLVNDLRHFSSYKLKMRVCQHVIDGMKRCSDLVDMDLRTKAKKGADDVIGDIREVGGYTNNKNESNRVYITWNEPDDPNSMVVYYNIRIKTHVDKQQWMTDCISAKKFMNDGRKYEVIVTGTYYVSVQAVSLFGPSAWTSFKKVSVAENYQNIILSVVIPTCVFLILAIFAFFYWRHKKPDWDDFDNKNYYDTLNLAAYEVARDMVTKESELGSGAFGQVYRGTFNHKERGPLECAIKMVKDNATPYQCREFLGEASVMKDINTAHVVKLLGVVSQGHPQMVILELMENGDLKNYLNDQRPTTKHPERIRPVEAEFLQMALEIADGMAYLSTVPTPTIIHRDLAARNCMVSKDKVVKVADFGMAREIYAEDYYLGRRGLMPVRWMAPESLIYGKYTTISDVWSYGVVLWEMVTLAEKPYQGLDNQEVLEFVKKGNKLEIPSDCPESLAQLMRLCWQYEPDNRPTFLDICHMLLPHANQRFMTESFINTDLGWSKYYAQQRSREENSSSGPPIGSIEPLPEAGAQQQQQQQQQEAPFLSDNDDVEAAVDPERVPLRVNGNSNGDARSTSTTDNGHAIMPSSSSGVGPVNSTDIRDFNRGQTAAATGTTTTSSSSEVGIALLPSSGSDGPRRERHRSASGNFWNRMRNGVRNRTNETSLPSTSAEA